MDNKLRPIRYEIFDRGNLNYMCNRAVMWVSDNKDKIARVINISTLYDNSTGYKVVVFYELKTENTDSTDIKDK